MANERVRLAIDGVLLLDKPADLSSNDVLQKVKRLYQAKKAGHTGALDPLATGMLPICFGEATKFSYYLLNADKRYQVTAKLGIRTDTSDAQGQVVSTRAVAVEKVQLLAAIQRFLGQTQQIPSMFSALKHQGRPLYYYARQGITIERPARPINVYHIELLAWQNDEIQLDIHCSKGTYIRTIIDDLGEQLGCGAHVTVLRRLQVANYPLASMKTFEQLQQAEAAQLMQWLLPMESMLQHYPELQLDKHAAQQLRYGQVAQLAVTSLPVGLVRLVSEQQFIGLGELDESGRVMAKRLLATG